jgi:hypothetical protein
MKLYDNGQSHIDPKFGYKNHVQYERHYSKSHAGTWITVILFAILIAYAWMYVPMFRTIVTMLIGG